MSHKQPTRYYVIDMEHVDYYGRNWGLYDAATRTHARIAFMEQWDYPQEYWFRTKLRIRKQRPCETCGGTGILPHPEDHEDFGDGGGEFCPDCLFPENRKQEVQT